MAYPEVYNPSKAQTHWCADCDHNLVNSDRPETGNFFVVFGHSWSQKEKAYDGEYTGVMYAICKSCQLLNVNSERDRIARINHLKESTP
jgi:hypothetical protein